MIQIIVDSTCDIPEDLQKKYGIKMIPLQVVIDDKTYLDKVDIETEKVYQYIKSGVDTSTSLPSFESLFSVFKECLEAKQPFVFLSFSSKMSGTYQFAKVVIDELKEVYPEAEMAVVDSRSGALGIGLIAIRLAVYAQEGHSFSECLDQAEYLIGKIEHLFMLDDLTQLAKGGRISNLKALGGNLLKVKPILDVQNGTICLIKQIRGTQKALNELASLVKERIGSPDQWIGINYADNRNLAEQMAEILEREYGFRKFIFQSIGSVLSTHIGVNAVGVFFFSE